MSGLLTRRARSSLGVVAARVEHSLRRKLLDKVARELRCLGCRCTDESAGPGRCSWTVPGLCSNCAPRSAEILAGNANADDLMKALAQMYVNAGFRSFPVMSLAALAWLREPAMANQHADNLAEGARLAPFTTVFLGKGTVSFRLVYKPPKGEHGTTYTYSYRIRSGTKKRNRR